MIAVRVLSVIAELELGNIQRHIFSADFVERVNAEVKAGQRAGAKPGQFAARRRVRSAASASAEMAGVS
jgi:hypothetical protein